MLLVKTKIGPSKINGTGLFAQEFIPKGTPVWRWLPEYDLRASEDELSILSAPAREQFVRYCYFSRRSNKFVLCFDDARFINHSDQANLMNVPTPDAEEDIDVAARDIFPDEEITGDYREGDPVCLNYPAALKEEAASGREANS